MLLPVTVWVNTSPKVQVYCVVVGEVLLVWLTKVTCALQLEKFWVLKPTEGMPRFGLMTTV